MPTEGGPSSNGRTLAKVAVVAAGVAVAGAALYQLSRRARAASAAILSLEDVKKRKEEGNVHFAQQRYNEAITKFTEALEGGAKLEQTKDLKELLAQCYQNRAAARQQRGDDLLVTVGDVASAIIFKPDYGRAYSRRAQLLKKEQPKQALADTLAAMHLDEKFSEQLVPIMAELMESLEKLNMQDLQKQKELSPVTKPLPIIQDQLYLWLHKTTDSDYLRKRYMSFRGGGEPIANIDRAFEALSRKDYVEAQRWAEKGEGDAECTLLAARFAYFQGDLEKFERLLERFEREVEGHDHAEDLCASAALLSLQTAKTIPELLELFERVVTEFGPRPDLFSVAAFRCTFLDDWAAARTILTDARLVHSKISQILSFFVEINTIILKNESPMDAFKVIKQMEEFVDAFDDKDEHKNWGALALSKIYITFNNTNNAEVLLKELRRRDPTWSIYPIALAHVYTQMGEYKKATEACEDTLKIEPINPEALLLKGSLLLHAQGNKLSRSSFYEKILQEADPLLERCLSNVDFPFVNEVLRHVSFTQAKISASKSIGIE